MSESLCAIVRKSEDEYIRGNTQTSKYVNFSMFDTISRIDAYLNSKHITGEFDSLGREKPFFNITIAAANIWMRATDIDRKQINLRATKSKDWLDTFLMNIHLQDWMRKERFGVYLNEWGRVLSRYGSAVTKKVENDSGLHLDVLSWGRIICDPVDFDSNPKIEPIELTEAQLYGRIKTHGYNTEQVKLLMNAVVERETLDRQKKDNRPGYIRIYEIHGNMSIETLKDAKGETVMVGDDEVFTQQMAVVSFVGIKKGRSTEYKDFVLYAGRESEDPYRIDHLIKESDRTLAKGAVEYLFDAQWMVNHSMKNEKDTLDIASRLVFQTADANFVNMNVLENIESGDFLIHGVNMPITQVQTGKYDISSTMNLRNAWKEQASEIAGISDAMLGVLPKSGTPAAQTAQILQENYSLFELMVENKGLAIEDMMREWILPYIKRTQMNSSKEIAATLESHDITRIDSVFFKNEAIKQTNRQMMSAINDNLDRIARKEPIHPIDATGMFGTNMQSIQDSMAAVGNLRSFKPSEISNKTWKSQFKNLESEVEVDVSGENFDKQNMLQALNTALMVIVNPAYAQNKRAQAVVGKMLELWGAMSPIEYNSIPSDSAQPALPASQGGPQIQTPTTSTVGA